MLAPFDQKLRGPQPNVPCFCGGRIWLPFDVLFQLPGRGVAVAWTCAHCNRMQFFVQPEKPVDKAP